MDVTTAYAVLRLKPESSLDEAGKVFDAQAVRLDPERVKRSLRPAAESRMAQVNDAWDAVRQHLESGGGPVTYEVAPPPEQSQRPVPAVTQPRPADISLSTVTGWHTHPDGVTRYWDGEQWTGRIARPARAQVSFPQAVKSALTQYASFSGRARRSEYWWFVLFTNIVSLVVGFCAGFIALIITMPATNTPTEAETAAMDNAIGIATVVSYLFVLPLILPGLALMIRRLHDTNRSGWHCFTFLIPLVGGILLLMYTCEDSGDGPNRYCPSPKYS
jgi:uncharacterized membrane protein YhaH (DUF805 family)